MEKKRNVHRIWHNFAKIFLNEDCPPDKKWKYTGYDFMHRVEKYVKRHPEIKLCPCDDSFFASSTIAFIPHFDPEENNKSKRYFGTTVVVIPQCDGQQPCQFFLYPGHVENLLKELKKIEKD